MTEKPTINSVTDNVNKRDLTQGSVAKHLLRLSMPMYIGMFSIICYQLGDAYFVAQLGTDALAALSFTFPVTMVLLNVMFGYSVAMTSIVARKLGQKRSEQEIKRTVMDGMLISSFLMILLTGVTAILNDRIFMFLGAEKRLLPLISEYMDIWYLGSLFFVLPIIGNAALRANGDTVIPSCLMVAFAAINLVMDKLLIFGHWGFPAMGIKGASLATVIANAVTLLVMLWVMYVRDRIIDFKCSNWSDLRHSATSFNKIGLPAGLMNLVAPVFTGVVTAIIAPYGVAAVAAFGVIGRIETLAFSVWIALALGLIPLIGQNFGQRSFERVEDSVQTAIKFCILAGFVSAVLLMLFAKPVIAFFNADPEVVAVGYLYLIIVPITYIFYGVLRVYAAAFNGIGMAKRALFLTVLQAFILGVPSVFIGSEILGLKGVFGGIALSYGLSGLMAYCWYRYKEPLAQLMQKNAGE
tara:strand:- start:441 stop:1841 length:1401 start_codon:yes stop_codon:yes gene_type:complete